MRLKRIGFLCLVLATTGFGFHNWYLNNKISDIEIAVARVRTEKDHYYRAYERFREGEVKKLLHEITLNVGLLFGKLDIKFSGSVRPQTEEGIQTAEENMLKADRKRLLELAFTAASSQADQLDPHEYVAEVDARLGDMSNRQEFDRLRDEVTEKIHKELQRVQDERDALLRKSSSLQSGRDGWYLLYLCVQITGIVLAFAGETQKSIAPAQQDNPADS